MRWRRPTESRRLTFQGSEKRAKLPIAIPTFRANPAIRLSHYSFGLIIAFVLAKLVRLCC